MGVESRIEPACRADFALKAARPQYCALSNAKLLALGIEMPRWDESAARLHQAELVSW